jgi:hypothetical protein
MITFEAHFPLSHLLFHCSFINPHLDFFLVFLSSSTRRMPMTSLPTQIEGASLHLLYHCAMAVVVMMGVEPQKHNASK